MAKSLPVPVSNGRAKSSMRAPGIALVSRITFGPIKYIKEVAPLSGDGKNPPSAVPHGPVQRVVTGAVSNGAGRIAEATAGERLTEKRQSSPIVIPCFMVWSFVRRNLRCVRYWDFVRKRDRTGKHIMAGSLQEREVLACIITFCLR
jgi:hypothetical protein